ncbi:MAG: hypothetical protein IJ113_09780 [Eggerthellaceae bacterium]|nr:hypothetical protein [Eggerthellaceae bacterium]
MSSELEEPELDALAEAEALLADADALLAAVPLEEQAQPTRNTPSPSNKRMDNARVMFCFDSVFRIIRPFVLLRLPIRFPLRAYYGTKNTLLAREKDLFSNA